MDCENIVRVVELTVRSYTLRGASALAFIEQRYEQSAKLRWQAEELEKIAEGARRDLTPDGARAAAAAIADAVSAPTRAHAAQRNIW